jgi:hypothetical protein
MNLNLHQGEVMILRMYRIGIVIFGCSVASVGAATLEGTVPDPLDTNYFNRVTSTATGPNADGITTITHQMNLFPIDDAVRYEWNQGGKSPMTATVQCCDLQQPINRYTTLGTAVPAGPGTITSTALTSGITATGQGQYFVPSQLQPSPPQGAMDQIIDTLQDALQAQGDVFRLVSELTVNPELKFISEVERISGSHYEYRSIIENYSDYDVDFNWQEAGVVGVVDPFSMDTNQPGTFQSAFQSANSPTEVSGRVSAMLTFEQTFCFENSAGEEICEVYISPDNEYIVTANVLTPVPLPAAAWLFLSGLSVLGYAGWQKQKA